MRTALAIACFVILIVHGIVFYNQFFHKWQDYQTTYYDQALTMAKTEPEKAAVTDRAPRIEQIIVTQFGETRVDRCTTCHMAMDDPRFDKYAQPLRTHPYSEKLGDRFVNGKWERRHKFSDFGCTLCHDGQGRGLEARYSHGEDEYWPEPLLGSMVQANWRKDFRTKLKYKELIEANCAQCHTEENFAGTPTVAAGRKLFFAQNCYGCHKIDGLSEGTLGPELTEAGKKFKVDYLWESIVDPTANLATSFMPDFHLSDDKVRALVVFLKSRKGLNFAETSLARYRAQMNAKREGAPGEAAKPALAGAALVSAGEKLIADRACTACHKLRDKDGGIAPDLTYEGLVKTPDWIADHFRNPRSTVPDSIMPAFRFQDEEFRAMGAYLTAQTAPPLAMAPEQTYKALCQRCHGEKGDGHGPIAWYLDPYPRNLTHAGFMNSKPLERLQNSIRNGVPGTSMPFWGKVLKDEQVAGVLNYVQVTFVKEARTEPKPRQVPENNPVPASAESAARGEHTFLERCTGCHGKKADGKGPNSLDILPRPRNLRNHWFVNSASDKRLFESIMYGVQGTAMPSWIDYGLQQSDIGDLINFIRSINPQSTRSEHARSN